MEEPEDRRIETHPDLVDPEWRKHAELDAWLGAKKELKKRRKRERRAQGFGGYGSTSRWPGVVAITLLIALVATTVILRQANGPGVNDPARLTDILYGAAAAPVRPDLPIAR
ncbi:hypothetical protein ACFWY9_24965 [Amycolatopsis sp. NPDC059027]|uniref:hypothetical protein n=1 Tax=unclassified Amycolatopsis TaxID=2618356 RepID=UPI00366CBD33